MCPVPKWIYGRRAFKLAGYVQMNHYNHINWIGKLQLNHCINISRNSEQNYFALKNQNTSHTCLFTFIFLWFAFDFVHYDGRKPGSAWGTRQQFKACWQTIPLTAGLEANISWTWTPSECNHQRLHGHCSATAYVLTNWAREAPVCIYQTPLLVMMMHTF